jgi:hypothetical protein
MDKDQVRKTVEQLVESHYDQRQIQSRLCHFQDASEPPLAPSKFESLEAFLDFYGRKPGHEDSIESLKTQDRTHQCHGTVRSGQARAILGAADECTAVLHIRRGS